MEYHKQLAAKKTEKVLKKCPEPEWCLCYCCLPEATKKNDLREFCKCNCSSCSSRKCRKRKLLNPYQLEELQNRIIYPAYRLHPQPVELPQLPRFASDSFVLPSSTYGKAY